MDTINAFVGLDVHKDQVSVAVAEPGRDGEVRYLGPIPNTPGAIDKLAKRLTKKHEKVEFVYEAGPCGYQLYRQLVAGGYLCRVVAPSRTPKKPTDRIKNDRRDAIALARLLRAGELVFVWVPDEVHEAMRELVRARQSAANEVRKARQRIQGFLLRYGRRWGRKAWSVRHRIWLANQKFEHAAQQIAFQMYLNAHDQAEARRTQIEDEMVRLLPHWQLCDVVEALRALRGVGVVIAVATVAEIGDIRRFASPRHLMAYLGLVPSEHSSGSTVRPGGITKVGNAPLRALLFEAAWSYRCRPKIGSWQLARMPDVPQAIKDTAWKAQLRLHARYRHLVGRGKKSQIAVTAVARELLGFIWAIMHACLPTAEA